MSDIVEYSKVESKNQKTNFIRNNTPNKEAISEKVKQTSTNYTKVVKIPETTNVPDSKTGIIDVYPEVINKVSPNYYAIESLISNSKITVSNEDLEPIVAPLISLIEKNNLNIQNFLEGLKSEMIEFISSIKYADESIENVDLKDFNFNDIWKYSKEIMASNVKIADESFFEELGYTVINNIVTIGEYQYNVKSHNFSINGKAIGNTYFYIPTGEDIDYSKLNTLTMLSDKDSNGIERLRDVGNTSNAIIIAFDAADSSYLKVPSNIAGTTKFINKAVQTDLEKCQNIITGGSRFGARSLKIAAETEDLYQTVICVNNALLVKGVTSTGAKESFDSIEQVKKLNGKNIYFISSKNDNNLNMLSRGDNGFANDSDVTKCYVYTGINILLENCPESQVYFISNNDNPSFANISHSNYHYGRDLWRQVAKSDDYSDHGSLHEILNDLCSSNLIGYNRYTNKLMI